MNDLCRICNKPLNKKVFEQGNSHIECWREHMHATWNLSNPTGVGISPAAQSPTSVGDDKSPTRTTDSTF